MKQQRTKRRSGTGPQWILDEVRTKWEGCNQLSSRKVERGTKKRNEDAKGYHEFKRGTEGWSKDEGGRNQKNQAGVVAGVGAGPTFGC